MANPYVFIVGCPRSGTTLLGRMVNAHPQIAITSESHWIPRLFEERKELTPQGLVTSQLIPRLLEDPRFTRWQVDREKLEALLATSQPVAYQHFVANIFDLYGQRTGKALVGNKTPWFVRRLLLLHALWPTARFVHLIRDGRDVCLSMTNWLGTHQNHPGVFSTWRNDSVFTAALWWELHVRLGREAGNLLGPELYYEVRYESMVANPEEDCAALCTFLGLPYDHAMLRFHEGRTKTDPGLDAKHAWLPITPGLRNWRSQMPTEDVERFEAAAGGLLDELGYPRAVPRCRPENLNRASRIRYLLAQDPQWIQAVPRPQAESTEPPSRIPDPCPEGSPRRSLGGGDGMEA